jgi:hypothetical protein
MDLESNCIKRKTPKDASVCQKYRARDECRAISDRKAKNWSVRCGAPVSLMRTMDVAPEDCSLCSEGANKILEDCIQHETLSFDSKCDVWRVAKKQRECYDEKFKYFSQICGKGDLHEIDFHVGPKPKRCIEETPE